MRGDNDNDDFELSVRTPSDKEHFDDFRRP
jgi:hypothetical protein